MSNATVPVGLFKPALSKQESKADVTTRVAREIAAAEKSAADSKTARLRALRLQKEAEEKAAAPALATSSSARRKSSPGKAEKKIRA